MRYRLMTETQITEMADSMLTQDKTVRQLAVQYHVSKSTVYTMLTKDLRNISTSKYKRVKQRLRRHKLNRHIQGGIATAVKWARLRAQRCINI